MVLANVRFPEAVRLHGALEFVLLHDVMAQGVCDVLVVIIQSRNDRISKRAYSTSDVAVVLVFIAGSLYQACLGGEAQHEGDLVGILRSEHRHQCHLVHARVVQPVRVTIALSQILSNDSVREIESFGARLLEVAANRHFLGDWSIDIDEGVVTAPGTPRRSCHDKRK